MHESMKVTMMHNININAMIYSMIVRCCGAVAKSEPLNKGRGVQMF
jgi:hypothetical protein